MSKTIDRITTTTSNLKIKRFERAKQIKPKLTEKEVDDVCQFQNSANSTFLNTVVDSLSENEFRYLFEDTSNLLRLLSTIYKSDSFPECGTALYNLASLFLIVKSNTTNLVTFEQIKSIGESMGKTEADIIKSEQLLLDAAQLSVINFQRLIDEYKEFLFSGEPVNLDFETIDYEMESELEKQDSAFVN